MIKGETLTLPDKVSVQEMIDKKATLTQSNGVLVQDKI